MAQFTYGIVGTLQRIFDISAAKSNLGRFSKHFERMYGRFFPIESSEDEHKHTDTHTHNFMQQ